MSDERGAKSDWPAILFLLVGLPLAFTYGGIWIGLIVLAIGVVVLGWRKRLEGPFPTDKGDGHEEVCVDVNSLAQQFTGRKFGELVLHHYKKQDFPTIVAALQGTIEELPESARRSVESWIDEIAPFGADPSFWQRDCGEVFLEICGRARHKLASHALRATDDQLLSMFNIIVLNFAYGAHKHPGSKAFIQRSIGIGFLRRLFS